MFIVLSWAIMERPKTSFSISLPSSKLTISLILCTNIVSKTLFLIWINISEQKPESSQEVESEEGDNLNFEDAREGGNDESFGDSDEVEDEQLMVIETPEGLTLVEPTDNSSFYIVQEHEGHETPLGTFNIHGVIQVFQRLQIFPF